MAVRQPAVAGQFYAGDTEGLRAEVAACFTHRLGPGKMPPAAKTVERICGLVSPHAGYMYSGSVAAHGYYACSSLEDVELFVIVGPNHYGLGSGVATVREGRWRTPLGDVLIDAQAAKELVAASGLIDFDELAHQREHSIEVQVPFLQFIFGERHRILPVSMALQDRKTAVEVGTAIASVVKKRRAVLIASSDFTHYEPHEQAARKDGELIKAIVGLDVAKHYTTLERLNVTACGYGPIAAIMTAVKELRASGGRLLKYATSGETSGDYGAVVGYASILFA